MNKISEVTRKDIFDLLRIGYTDSSGNNLYFSRYGRFDEIEFLKRIYDLSNMNSYDHRHSNAEGDIYRHTVLNDDWDKDWVFGDARFNLEHSDDEILLKFLCEMFHPAVRNEKDNWKLFLDKFNELLAPDGYELYESGHISGRNMYGWRNLADRDSLDSTTTLPTSTLSNMAAIEKFQERFYDLHRQNNRQEAGLEFEKFLYDLFCHFNLKPRPSFSVTGEQIDGSFELDSETYLFEAKWQAEPIQENALLIFRGKIEGKSVITRGAFISVNGYTANAIQAICTGKQPNFFLIDGMDINNLLCYKQDLIEVLRFKRRSMAEGNLLARFDQ